MKKITVTRSKYPQIFGGIGFHNAEALIYPITEKEHFNQILCKCYREIAPGFMRTFGGYDDWSKDSMDAFYEYYCKMQKVTDTPIYLAAARGKLHFSEEEMEQYCERVADNLQYLKQEKGMKHLRYYCFSNEMSQVTWGALLKNLPLFKKYHEMLYRAFQNRGLDIGLLATDASGYDGWKTIEWAIQNMNAITEDYCGHVYERDYAPDNLEFYDFFYNKCNEMVKKTVAVDGKRFILGEIGIQKGYMTLGNGVVVDACRYFEDPKECAESGLLMAEMAFSAINAGVFALAFWSYADLPDPFSCAYSEKEGYAKEWGKCEKYIAGGTTDVRYNKWGILRWEDDGDYSPREVYWCLAPMIKLFKRNSKVLTINTEDDLLRACGIMNRDGSVSIGIVNRHTEPCEITLDSTLFNKNIRVYEYDCKNVPVNAFADIQDFSVLDNKNPVITLKASSVTFFTTDYEEKLKPVVAKGVRKKKGTLIWQEISDENHCYYRVYADEKKGFVPSAENQIASTVATELPITNQKLHYKVLSVDIWGNV